ncbi:MAG: hypothetical protein ACRCUD_00985 [Cetobacterium sp.]
MSLIEKIVCSENIKMAIDNIRKNKGSQTPETFEKSIEKLIEKQLDIRNDNINYDWKKMK